METLKPVGFENEVFLDFSDPQLRAAFKESLAAIQQQLPFSVEPKINGAAIRGKPSFTRYNPAKTNIEVAHVTFASKADTLRAIDSLAKFQPAYEEMPLADRCRILATAATIMRKKKLALIALVTIEAGKPVIEADREVCEAIDFCDYYAFEAQQLLVEKPTDNRADEENSYFYQSRGVTAVISPWNFPFAITCGMTVAALVCGNVVALKPSRQTSAIAAALVDILLEAGLPPEALAFLPGSGVEIGGALADDKRVSLYCFTGSREVGLELIGKGAIVQDGQTHIKRVIAELGGKNAMIIDEGCDLVKAAQAVNYSAFGYSGQKCSACARLIVVGNAYEPLLHELKAIAETCTIGDPAEFDVLVGPLIDEGSRKKVSEYITLGKKDSAPFVLRTAPEGGYYSDLAIFRDVKTDSPLWREEIFGTVLVACQAKDFDDALRLANDADYGLTGGVFSNSKANLAKAKKHFKVGNLYFNRTITGALVNRQPFGGFKLSGVGSKAGGKDYLLQFVEPRALSNKI